MSEPPARTFSSDFRRFFLRGLVVLLPSVLTLWIVVAAYQFVEGRIAEPINRGVRLTMNNTARYWSPLAGAFDPAPAQLETEVAARAGERRRAVSVEAVRLEMRQRAIDEWWEERWYMNLIGLVIAIVGVYTAGRLLGGFFGRHIYRRLESLITTLPVFKQVYPYVKQIVDFLFSDEQSMKFSRVVATEYPRKGIWSIGFQTGPAMSAVADQAGDAVTIFIPSSPTPFTGYTITVPRKDVIEVPISVEEAIRFAVSAGVLVPDHQLMERVRAARAAVAAGGSHAQRPAGELVTVGTAEAAGDAEPLSEKPASGPAARRRSRGGGKGMSGGPGRTGDHSGSQV